MRACNRQRQIELELQWSCNGVAHVKGNWLAGVAMKLQWSCTRQRQLACWSCNGAAMELQMSKAIGLLELQ